MKASWPVRWWVVAPLAAVCSSLVFGGTAQADCAAPGNESEAQYETRLLDGAELVVIGAAEKVTVQPQRSLVEVRVERVFEGDSEPRLTVKTNSGSAVMRSEEVQFEEGTRYLLYLNRVGEKWTTDVCAGTRPIGNSLPPEAEAVLGDGSGPRDAELPETGGPGPRLLIAAGLVLCVGMAVRFVLPGLEPDG